MQPEKVVVAQHDMVTAAQLAASLHRHFRSVSVARTIDEVRLAIPKHRPEFAVLDLETVPIEEVERLCHEFQGVPIVCTHRVPDEQMWTEALSAGAVDVCQTNDVSSILEAVRRNTARARSNAA